MIDIENAKEVDLSAAISHISAFLSDEEKDSVMERISDTTKRKNIFWDCAYFSFYYGSPQIDVTNTHPSKMDNRHYLKITFGQGAERSWEEGFINGKIYAIPFNKISLNVGDKISCTGNRRTFSVPNSKYCDIKPPYEVLSIDGDQVRVFFIYKSRTKKEYRYEETWSLKQTEIDIYRRSLNLE